MRYLPGMLYYVISCDFVTRRSMRFCGVDIGTTNTKAVLVDEDMNLLDCLSLPVCYPAGTYQLPGSVWYDHFLQVLDRFAAGGRLNGQSLACSVTGQGGSFVMVDEAYQPVSPAYSWMMQCRPETVRSLASSLGSGRFYQTTGWEPSGGTMACKVKEWLAANPNFAAAKVRVATVPEFIHAQLFGRFVSDLTTSQMTGLLDFRRNVWDPDILAWVGIGEESLPEVADTLRVIEEGIKVAGTTLTMVTSSHDQYAAMTACGVTEGTIMLGTGSAWVINGKSRTAIVDDRYFMVHPGRDIYGGNFGYITSLGPVGKGLDVLLRQSGLDYRCVDAEAGKDGPVREYMANVAAKVRYVLEMTGATGTVKKLRMTGGAAKSRVWPQLVANICNVPIEAVQFEELTAFGAAVWARSAMTGNVGMVRWPRTVDVHEYEPREAARYEEWYQTEKRPVLAGETLT